METTVEKTSLTFRTICIHEPGVGYTLYIKGLEEVTAHGATKEEARNNLLKALEVWSDIKADEETNIPLEENVEEEELKLELA